MLIVDNDEMNRFILSRRLKYEGYSQVLTADDGQQALEMMRADSFDLIFLDVMMPGMNGYQVLEEMAKEPRLKNVPVIVISAADNDSATKCMALGAKDYLTKPFESAQLRTCLTACLPPHKLQVKKQTVQ